MADISQTPWTARLRDPRFRTIFYFGMASGLPSSLVFATLSIWLREEGITRTSIGLIGAAATPYAINFLWAPFVDRFRLGWLQRLLGQRRSWILFCQVLLVPAIIAMGLQDPGSAAIALGICALTVSALSATQDVAIDAYRVEILETHEYGAGAALAIYGWHTGAFVTGAGALYVAAFGGWAAAYGAAALVIALVAVTTLLAREPERPAAALAPAKNAVDWLRNAAVAPLTDFFGRLGWLAALVLAVIVFYKFGDAMLGRMAGVFYVDLGFTKIEIANYTKSVGLLATLLGVGVGGWVCIRIGIMRAMFLGAFLMMVTNLAFALLATSGKNFELLATVVFFDNLTGGMATTAFVAYLSSLCNVAFTATQYALLASLGNFARIQLGSVSGWAVDSLGGEWTLFFVGVAAMSIPAILLLWMLVRLMPEIERRG
ncbi:MAG: AmpG family muropeptide MFS transporter [Alphaproteobacteria bacterium]